MKKHSLLDKKTFLLTIEIQKNPIIIIMKIHFNDLFMSIEDADEIVLLNSAMNNEFPEISFSLDEEGRVILKIVICLSNFHSLNKFYSKIIEMIDCLLILAKSFYTLCIKNILYHRPTKDRLSYLILSKIIHGTIDSYKREISYFISI